MSPKRKTEDRDEQSKKRTKLHISDESLDRDNQHAQILRLESNILQSKKHYNDIGTLINIARGLCEDSDGAVEAAVSLCRVFIRLIAAGSLTDSSNNPSQREAVVIQWLREKLVDFTKTLLVAFEHDETATIALTLAMRTLKATLQYMGQQTKQMFPQPLLQEIVGRLLQPEVGVPLREKFFNEFVKEHDDLRYYTFKAISVILTDMEEAITTDQKIIQQHALEMLAAIDDVPSSNEQLTRFYVELPTRGKSHKLCSLPQHKRQAQQAWLALMKLGLDKQQKQYVLRRITTVLTWFSHPEFLMDFMTDCYDAGGSLSILALSGVLYLIQERNLDYPAFYTKLYSLLDINMLHSRHRSRFFRLLDTALASTHLPAALVASFIKRLSRLSLHAPPAAIVYILPFCYNLFRKHPTTTFMMHRVVRRCDEEEEMGFEDTFVPEETNPMATNAIDSCVWELVQLQDHYHPSVATIARIISEQFTKPSYSLEHFLDHSYGSLLDAEMSKLIKKPPVVEFIIPKQVFASRIMTEVFSF